MTNEDLKRVEEIRKRHNDGDYGWNDERFLMRKLDEAIMEIEILRAFGNKDCTAQADEILNTK
jgi:hypothetical protein